MIQTTLVAACIVMALALAGCGGGHGGGSESPYQPMTPPTASAVPSAADPGCEPPRTNAPDAYLKAAEQYLKAAEQHSDAKDHRQAADAYLKAAEQYSIASDQYHVTNSIFQGINAQIKAVEQRTKAKEQYLKAAEQYSDAKDHRQAADAYFKAKEQYMAMWQASNAKVYLEAAVEQYLKATEQYLKAAEQYSDAKDHRQAADAWLKAAEYYSLAQSPEEEQMYFAEAAKQYYKAAGQENREAQYQLGVMHAEGQAVRGRIPSENYIRAAQWFYEAAKQRHPKAQYRLGLAYAEGKGVPRDYSKAKELLREAAGKSAELLEAQYRLGLVYENLDENGKAMKEYCKAAKRGHTKAEYRLGLEYESYERILGNLNEDGDAMKWYRRAADKFPAAKYKLGRLYHKMGDEKKDEKLYEEAKELYKMSVKLYKEAGNEKYSPAQNNLGFMYDAGRGVEKDAEEAVKWFRRAAKQGSRIAQYNLALMYDAGRGVEMDVRAAVKWFLRAAEQGYSRAQYNLALMYDAGRGVEKDVEEAVKWFRRAAKQDDPSAQHWMGVVYDRGLGGVKRDLEEAMKWFLKSAENKKEYPPAWNTMGLAYVIGWGVEKDHDKALYYAERLEKVNPEMAQAIRDEIDVISLDALRAARERVREKIRESEQQTKDLAKEQPVQVGSTSLRNKGSGSGFLVSSDGKMIVTNNHVIVGCDEVTVSHEGMVYSAEIEKTDPILDLALLRLQKKIDIGEEARFSESPRVSLGEAVTVAGYPTRDLLGYDLNVTSGIVSKLSGSDDMTRLNTFQFTAPIQGGNSGGPVLDDAGNVIGVTVASLPPLLLNDNIYNIQNVNFAIKGVLVQKFLRSHGVAFDPRPSDERYPAKDLAEKARKFTVSVQGFGESGCV